MKRHLLNEEKSNGSYGNRTSGDLLSSLVFAKLMLCNFRNNVVADERGKKLFLKMKRRFYTGICIKNLFVYLLLWRLHFLESFPKSHKVDNNDDLVTVLHPN